jgi:hypothetical protein
MKKNFRSRAPWLATLALTLLAAPAFAQVPQHMTYTGRLVDNLGDPLAGPVSLELRIWDAAVGGSQTFVEAHFGVDLDATGAFSVQLGQGLHLNPLDATDFSGVDRWIEMVVDSEVLTPRQRIGSVPWALVAERLAPPAADPNITPRFEDCGDGTVADHQTGLQWEKKTGTVGTAVFCDTVTCTDPHDVNNRYQWSLGPPYEPDGGAFTDFLARLNGGVVAATSGEAHGDPAAEPKPFGSRGHREDWQLPTIGELRTILVGPDAAPSSTCSSAPCIAPEFAAVGGPTALSLYWSASTFAGNPLLAWVAFFENGLVGNVLETFGGYVRAVRAGSCN